jgi:cytochrome c oxidase cbb3-type subunit 3
MTLDGASENGPLPAGGPVIIAAPASVATVAANITATPAELAQGQAAYMRVCAGCHAPDGKGGVGPALTGRTDFANIVRVINAGQGEMPSQAPKMTPAEIDAVAKYVVKTLNPQPAGRGGAAGAGRGGAPGRGGNASPAED